MERRERGIHSEALAEAYLRRRGYRILARNFRCRMGELDLVALDGDELVFVEVRSRTSEAYGAPEESIIRRKQKRLRRTAEYYLLHTGQTDAFCRFDVLGVVLDEAGRVRRIEHLKAAF